MYFFTCQESHRNNRERSNAVLATVSVVSQTLIMYVSLFGDHRDTKEGSIVVFLVVFVVIEMIVFTISETT